MNKQIITFSANEQQLIKTGGIDEYAGEIVAYIEAHFDLGENWSGYDSVRAVWYNPINSACIATVLDSQGHCIVPHEVLIYVGKVQVNLVGSIVDDDVLTDRITTHPITAVTIKTKPRVCGTETAPITPSQFDQYVAIVQALVGSVRDIDHISLNPDYTLTIYYSDGTSDTTSSIRGATGNGIASIAKTGSSGSNPKVDTYTITYTDGNTTTFTVTNGVKGDTGNGISKIEKTGSSGTNPVVDTYTVTYTNGQTFTFTVTNGLKGDTGNGIQSIYKTGESGAVKTYTILMTDGSTFDFDVTDGEVTQAVLDATVDEINSDIYESTIVQVKSDNEPYHFRRTNNGNGSGHREYDEIAGASVAWNQLMQNGNFADTSGWIPYGGTISASGNVCTFTASSPATTSRIQSAIDIKANHAFLIRYEIKADKAVSVGLTANNDYTPLYTGGTLTANTWTTFASIKKSQNANDILRLYINVNGVLQDDDKVYIKNINIIDLTLALRSQIADYIYTLEQNTAGSGVSFFKKYFPLDFYSFDSGSIQSVSGLVSHDMTGFNQWDEEWELGAYNPTTGAKDPNPDAWRNKNLIPILPNTSYYIYTNSSASSGGRIFWYDANEEYISFDYGFNATKMSPSNAHYCNFRLGTTHADGEKVCINISDPSKNGTYEQYVKHSYELDPTITLRGKFNLVDGKLVADGDIYPPSGEGIGNYAEVDLGSLEWNIGWGGFWTNSIISVPNGSYGYPNLVCNKYVTVPAASSDDKSITVIYGGEGYASNGWIKVLDSAYTDANTFKTAVTGTKLVYELATPTTFTATPYTKVQKVDMNGTEEYVSTSIVPIGHNTDYPMTLIDTMPSANGNYTMKLNVASGKKTISWQSV